ncbi:MAG TPA: Asp-tRNA(Asn)/Glu-tRNA(Gln) amidotransferase GatCAB subunit B, partial [Candidatus Jeotgalibaca merdavium]|nr:Asp-tRNA(Asn)/Glu-tRNA(Gln) amidotransferase GatCAB subunit B [Candidatus Jeotgalibaca merdavium]
AGGVIQQETRRFDETTGETLLMRVKEGSSDYRYFPEPDLPPLEISQEWLEEVRAELPIMPKERRHVYINQYDLPEYDAMVLTLSKEMSDFFEGTIAAGADPKQASNWLMGEVSAYLNSEKLELHDTKLTPANLAGMIQLIADGTISSKIAKKVFRLLATKGGDAKEVVEKEGLIQLSDPSQLLPIINAVLDGNQQSIEDFKAGKDRAKGFLVGQIMKQTKGQANPGIVNKLLAEELGKR